MSALKMRKRQREFTNDIFLSFNGKDTRKSFTDHLYSALTRRGIETFRDDKSLERGQDFAPELLRAIRESWGSIIVISEGYAFSHWCLEELVEIMKQREERGHRVYPVFYHAEPSDFRHQINSVKVAFDKHKQRYNEETTQGWRVALKKLMDINGWPLKDQYESVFIEDIVKDVSTKIDAEIPFKEEIEKMKSTFQTIQASLVDAENKQNMKEGEVVKLKLDKLKHIAYDMDDLLDEWNTAIYRSNIEKDQGQTPSTSSSSLSEVHNIPLRIKMLNEDYQNIIRDTDIFKNVRKEDDIGQNSSYERPKETTSLIDESDIYGRDQDKDALIRMLLSDDNTEGGSGNDIPLLAIVGMGGIGKTALAQLAYHNDEVKKHFHQRLWVCVSNPFDTVGIAKAILEALKGTPSSFNNLEMLLEEMRKEITGKKFLLVLDDVWTEDEEEWKPLKLSLRIGSQESKILVTTRKETVASVMGCPEPVLIRELSDEDSWALFRKIVFHRKSYQHRENLESIGRECAKKCKGLPLAIKILASLLRSKTTREQWQRILGSHMWELDVAEKGLFSPLLLSYYDLRPPLRQCFSYCAIFPKDYEIKKDMLIKLWMAQGFLRETRGKEMEIVGEEHFEDLAARSFFQEFEKDKDDDSIIIGCKMHDIVHDFAQLLRKTECCVVAVASNGVEEQTADVYLENVRHLTFTPPVNKDFEIPDLIYNLKKLRSLLLDYPWYYGASSLEASLPKLFDQLPCLRMLSLHYSFIRELPQEIGKLIHLRYLSLDGNGGGLSELPEALCDLYNLQTLNIKRCFKLEKLPHGMEKLINLRHLQNDGTNILLTPKGMQRLTCLRTLEEISVGKKGGGDESETSFSLGDLGKLIHLRGKLMIRGLENVGDASEAREARLSTRAGLRKLTFNFGLGGEYYDAERKMRTRMMENEAFVLEALHPPQHLQFLGIEGFKGPAFPNWMTSLTSLKSIQLFLCCNWERLPPMGKLPSLESLSIRSIGKVKKVGEEFVGVETSSSSSSSSVNHNINIAFPNLKTLEFEDMPKWEEWEYENLLRSRGGDDSYSSSNTIITIMPKLQRLSIVDCRKLKSLPRHLLQSTALQELEIYRSLLGRSYNNETFWSSISHIPTVEIEDCYEVDEDFEDSEDYDDSEVAEDAEEERVSNHN